VLTGDLGFRRGGDSGVVHGKVLEFPRAIKWSSVCSAARGVQGRGRRRRLLPGEGVEGGWRRGRRWGGSADGVYDVSLQYSAGEKYQRGRRREGRGLGGERGARAHLRRRIRPEILADAAELRRQISLA
jgi:hypothetical protein